MQNEVNVRRAVRVFEYLVADLQNAPNETLKVAAATTLELLKWVLEEESSFGEFLDGGELIVDAIEAAQQRSHASASS